MKIGNLWRRAINIVAMRFDLQANKEFRPTLLSIKREKITDLEEVCKNAFANPAFCATYSGKS
jgi:hypothetical protein